MNKTPRRPFALLKTFGEVLEGSEAQEPILAKSVAASLLEWLTEIWEADALKAVGLDPRRRAIFHGPPGTGKTTLAHHLAGRLGLPIVLIRPDRLIDCWVGSSEKNLGQLFDAARPAEEGGEGPVLLFFDEFEAIGRKRNLAGSPGGAVEAMTRLVDVLLQRLDAHKGFVIAATNHGDALDPAVWRRFDMQIEIAAPGQSERERILARYLAPYGLPADQLSELAFSCETATPALIRQLCEGLKRAVVIGPKLKWDMTREAVFGRVIAGIEPHADVGKPRLWAMGSQDVALRSLVWPLPLATDVQSAPPAPARSAPADRVVALRPAGGKGNSRASGEVGKGNGK